MSKALVFGVLEVAKREIVWLEMPFASQLAAGINTAAVEGLLAQLSSRLSVGALLEIKAKAQGLEKLATPEADENYTAEWARNVAAVTQLLVD